MYNKYKTKNNRKKEYPKPLINLHLPITFILLIFIDGEHREYQPLEKKQQSIKVHCAKLRFIDNNNGKSGHFGERRVR